MLTIRVEPGWGDDIAGHVIPEMVRLADLLGIEVKAELDRVVTTARPGDDPRAIVANWRQALTLPPPRAASATFPDVQDVALGPEARIARMPGAAPKSGDGPKRS
jgi:hypothetical protein